MCGETMSMMMGYTDLTQNLHDFKARAAPRREHDLARHVYLERLKLFLARLAFELCALNILQNLLYTQTASKQSIRFGSRRARL